MSEKRSKLIVYTPALRSFAAEYGAPLSKKGWKTLCLDQIRDEKADLFYVEPGFRLTDLSTAGENGAPVRVLENGISARKAFFDPFYGPDSLFCDD